MPAIPAAPSPAAAPAANLLRHRPWRRFLLVTLPLAALLAAHPAPPSHAAFDLVPSKRPIAPPPVSSPTPSPTTSPAQPAAPSMVDRATTDTAPFKAWVNNPSPSSITNATPDAISSKGLIETPSWSSAGNASPGTVTPLTPASTATTVTATPLPPTGAGTPSATSPAAVHTVRGRATDVPLAGVIRTIVPPTVTIAPLPPDIATRRVSFIGIGRPWRDVLSESLTRANLSFSEDGNRIIVSAAPAVAATPPAYGGASSPVASSPIAVSGPTPITPHGQATASTTTTNAPPQITPPAPTPSPTPLASAAAPLSASPPPVPQAAKDGEAPPPPPPTEADIRAAANAPAPLPFGAAPPADGFEAAQRPRTWTVNPGDTLFGTMARWASSIGLPTPKDDSNYTWTFQYGGTFRNATYFQAITFLTAGAVDNGIAADWRFSNTTLVTRIVRRSGL